MIVPKKIVLNKKLIDLPLPPVQPLPVVLQLFKHQIERDKRKRAALLRKILIRQAEECGDCMMCPADFDEDAL